MSSADGDIRKIRCHGERQKRWSGPGGSGDSPTRKLVKHLIVVLELTVILLMRERAASLQFAPTSITP